MKTINDLTAEERAEADQMLAELRQRGYTDRDQFNELAPGVRVYHSGHRWPDALLNGSGVVVAITERDPSSWSQSWGAPDVEMVVAWDEPTFEGVSRLSTVAQYHVSAVSQ